MSQILLDPTNDLRQGVFHLSEVRVEKLFSLTRIEQHRSFQKRRITAVVHYALFIAFLV